MGYWILSPLACTLHCFWACRWQAWRGPSASGAGDSHKQGQDVTLETINEAPTGFRGPSRLRNASAVAASPVPSPVQHSTAASSPLRPSSAAVHEQPRSAAGLPLGEGVEGPGDAVSAPAPNKKPVAPSQLQASVTSTPSVNNTSTAGAAADDSRHSNSAPADTPAASWLHSNLKSMGWRLDPLVILLSLVVSCAALSAGAVQLAVRARTPEQQSAAQQVGGLCYAVCCVVSLPASLEACGLPAGVLQRSSTDKLSVMLLLCRS